MIYINFAMESILRFEKRHINLRWDAAMPPCVFSVVRKSIILARHSVKIEETIILGFLSEGKCGGSFCNSF